MLRLTRIAAAAILTAALAPCTAQAATIGVLGGDVDPELPLITDAHFFALTPDACGFEADSGFFCAAYEVPNSGDFPAVIDSLDFRMKKPDGSLFTTEDLDLFSVHESSDLPFLIASDLFDDGITFTLFDPLSASVDCGPVGSFCRADFYSVFDDVAAVSVVGVNGEKSPVVPEPATLALLCAGAAGVVARHSRRRGKPRLS